MPAIPQMRTGRSSPAWNFDKIPRVAHSPPTFLPHHSPFSKIVRKTIAQTLFFYGRLSAGCPIAMANRRWNTTGRRLKKIGNPVDRPVQSKAISGSLCCSIVLQRIHRQTCHPKNSSTKAIGHSAQVRLATNIYFATHFAGQLMSCDYKSDLRCASPSAHESGIFCLLFVAVDKK